MTHKHNPKQHRTWYRHAMTTRAACDTLTVAMAGNRSTLESDAMTWTTPIDRGATSTNVELLVDDNGSGVSDSTDVSLTFIEMKREPPMTVRRCVQGRDTTVNDKEEVLPRTTNAPREYQTHTPYLGVPRVEEHRDVVGHECDQADNAQRRSARGSVHQRLCAALHCTSQYQQQRHDRRQQ
jgi:hypothetical protein